MSKEQVRLAAKATQQAGHLSALNALTQPPHHSYFIHPPIALVMPLTVETFRWIHIVFQMVYTCHHVLL